MKLLIALCFTAALFAAHDPQQAKTDDRAQTKTEAKNQAKAEAPEKPLTEIPASAVEFEPGSYHYTDAKGKKWILRPTPFGIAKIEDTGVPLRKKGDQDHGMENVKVTEDGDSVKFERPGPFGTYKWEKKKADLDAGEKAAWEREKAKPAADEKAKPATKQN
jgi:hypothetical protein